jgi:hypothetical protein
MRAFIFTMDAIMALVPVFIIIAGISQISGAESLMLQGYILGSERIAQDTLEVMDATDDIESLNRTEVNDTLETLIPGYLNYTYEMEYNQSTILNITKGNISNTKDIMIAKRGSAIRIFNLSGELLEVSHFGSEATEPCAGEKGQPRVYNASFFVASDDLDAFDYWIRAEWISGTVSNWYGIAPRENVECTTSRQTSPRNPLPTLNQQRPSFLENINDDVTEGTTNTIYIRIGAQGEANFFIIKAPKNIDESLITGENAKKKQLAMVTLKVWRGG